MGCPELHIPHKDWSGKREELENYVAIERWARTRGCGGGSCYIQHREAIAQSIDGGAAVGDGAEAYEIVWDSTNTCGTLSDDQAMLMLILNWQWEAGFADPHVDNNITASAKGVWVADDSNATFIAGDTRLGLGQAWPPVNGPSWDYSDWGSLSVPLNIYPAGQDFHVWVAQNSGLPRDITIRADLFTVGGCGCVL